MKLIRWKYALPRLALVVVVVLALRLGRDPLLRWAIVVSGEATVGAKLELAEVKTSLRDGEIVLHGFAIANPRSPMKNLVQADLSRLKIDLNALLHQRLVVRDGSISGLQFDTDRTTSGELVEAPATAGETPSFLDPWLDSVGQFGADWLAQLDERLSTDLADQLESPRVVKQLQQRWPEQYSEIRAQVESLQQRGKELERAIREVRTNPLRNLKGLGALQKQLATAQQELSTLQQQLQSLPQQIETDRQAVQAARKHDEQFLRQQLQFTQIESESITQTLLGDATSQTVAKALDWIRWARRRIPSKKTARPVARGRGTTVLYGPAQPRYWIEHLQLAGRIQQNGQMLRLVGTLTNATSDPHLLAEPMRLALQGEDNSLAIEATIDRRDHVAKDQLRLVCPRLSLPGRRLGDASKLALQIAPSTAAVRVDIALTDDHLTGKIVFSQPTARLSLETTSAKNQQLASVLGLALENVKQIEAHVVLAGTLQKPEVSLQSDLGSQLAVGLNASIKQLAEQRSQTLLAATQEKVDAQLQRLAQAREQAQQELLAKLGQHQKLLGQLAPLTRGTSGLSIPQLGQSLRFGTQRK